MSQCARVAVALLPLPGCIALLVTALQVARRVDEFQKRVQFEAVVIGFVSTGVVVFVYGYLQKAHAVGPLNLGLVWLSMVGVAVVGVVAMMLDGAALRWFPGLYGFDEKTLRLGAAWLLYGASLADAAIATPGSMSPVCRMPPFRPEGLADVFFHSFLG